MQLCGHDERFRVPETERLPPRFDRILTAGVLVAFVLHRLWVTMSGRCPLDADEGIFGIMAIGLMRGKWSSFFLGQDYMGAFQAIWSAPFVLLLGAMPMALRVAAIAQGLVVLLVWRRILARLAHPVAWYFLVALVVFAPEFLATWMLRSRGCIEVLLLGSVWAWAMVELARSDRSFDALRRWWLLAGIAGGIGWWTSQLVVFFLLPGTILFLLVRSVRARLADGFSRGGVVLFGIMLVGAVLLPLRGLVPYDSVWSARLHAASWPIVGFALLAAGLGVVGVQRRWLPAWPLIGLGGFIAGMLPALPTWLFKTTLYNTTSLQEAARWLVNASTMVFEVAGAVLGLTDERFEPLGLPLLVLVAVPAVYAAAVLASLVLAWRGRGRDASAERVLLAGFAGSFLLLVVILRPVASVPHYAVTLAFLLTAMVACFLGRLWNAAGAGPRERLVLRAVAAGCCALLVVVNTTSILRQPPVPVEPWTGVRLDDRAVIDFLLERDITIAASSLTGSSNGYWQAYRISFSSGERVRIHPVLHMPRVDAYREELKRATRIAIVTLEPATVAATFQENDIAFESERVGDLTIFWNFDKARVDALGLLSYAATL
jgi:hypothetical protein